jgi:hypothetical protein
MAIPLNLEGQRFGRLVAQSNTGSLNGQRVWLCACDCGNAVSVRATALKSGNTSSCGCFRREDAKARFTRHDGKPNGRPTPEYAAWSLMRDRCNNPKNQSYAYYGGRGITVSPRWNDFPTFLADMGARPTKLHTLDRYPNQDGNYEPENCRWATRKEQSRNRAYCKRVTWDGKERLLWELAEERGIKLEIVHHRLHRGWTLERTLTQPLREPTCPIS